jgi:cytosine/adenosine deaminase-related metal-dependent hydrolase
MSIQITLRARWVFPVEAPPVENGIVEISDDRIVAVHGGTDPRARDLGNVAIIPALINCHTHLELSDVGQPLEPPLPFPAWIRRLVAHRRARTITAEQAVKLGRRECLRSGSAWVGDIVQEERCAVDVGRRVDFGEFEDVVHGTNRVMFREVLGLRSDQLDAQIRIARRFLESNTPPSTRVGLSPHAPYSVHPDLIRAVVNLAIEFAAPLAIHLAETPAELELLRDGTGELVEMLQQFGVWSPDAIPRGSRPFDYLCDLAAVSRLLVIHGNYLDREELDFLAACPHIHVVYCPRTHAYFQHEPHPWRDMLSRGIGVALGTDSRASNPDLSLWNELLFLNRRHPDVPPATLLHLGTLAAATALGVNDITGSLVSGKLADLAVISLPAIGGTDAAALLFDPGNRVVSTMVSGEW